MKQINSLSEYKEYIRRNKCRQGSVDTNCMLLSSNMEIFITENRLFLAEFDDGIAVYIDEGCYYNLYYHWKKGKSFPDLRQDKPVIIEELNNRGARDLYLSRIEPLLQSAGFVKYRVNLQLECSLADSCSGLEQMIRENALRLENLGLRFDFCKSDTCMQKVLALWTGALALGDIPHSHRVLDPGASVLCILNTANEIVAASWWRHTASSESRHIVTRNDFHRKGLASAMLCIWLADAREKGISRCFTWINENNTPSLRMYKKFGFVYNGRISKQFILE